MHTASVKEVGASQHVYPSSWIALKCAGRSSASDTTNLLPSPINGDVLPPAGSTSRRCARGSKPTKTPFRRAPNMRVGEVNCVLVGRNNPQYSSMIVAQRHNTDGQYYENKLFPWLEAFQRIFGTPYHRAV